MKSVAVFFGGKSVEHDISILSGVMALNSIDKTKFNPIPIYIDRSGNWLSGKNLFDLDLYKNLVMNKLNKVCIVQGENVLYQIKGKKLKKIDNIFCAVNCLHGERGEDGSLAGLLAMSNIPITSSGILLSAISMDKSFSKLALKGLNVPVIKSVSVKSTKEVDKVLKNLNFPLIVKPNMLGSSIGITKASDKQSLIFAISNALKYGESAIIEPFLQDFIEINCAVFRDENGIINVSECERPIARDKILSFGDKYQDGKREFPAKIDKEISAKIKSITKKVYEKLNFDGVIRIDYFVVGNKVFLNEINSVPGSLSYYLFYDTMKGFSKMLTRLIMSADRKFLKNNVLITEYNSGILSSFGSKGSKHL